MKEYVNRAEIRPDVIQDLSGATPEEIGKYTEIIQRMSAAIKESLADRNSRSITNLPPQVMHKLGSAVASASLRGHMAERYYTSRLGMTKENIVGAGDYYTSTGKRGEMKFSSPHVRETVSWTFNGIRLEDGIDEFTFIKLSASGDSIDVYKVPRPSIMDFTLHESVSQDSYKLVLSPNGKQAEKLQKFKTDITIDDARYFGPRLHAFKFLNDNGVTIDDLDRILEIRNTTREKLRGFNRPNHATFSELFSLRPFVDVSHFGLIMQSWVADRMFLAQSANHLAAGDIVAPQKKRIEVKTSSANTRSNAKVHVWQGIEPAKFDQLVLVALHEDCMEYFTMTSRQFNRTFKPLSGSSKAGVYRLYACNLHRSGHRDGTVSEVLRRKAYNKDLNLNG